MALPGAVQYGLMNKIGQVSSDGHQMSLAGVGAGARGISCLMSRVQGVPRSPFSGAIQ